jgi:hypothetical protein
MVLRALQAPRGNDCPNAYHLSGSSQFRSRITASTCSGSTGSRWALVTAAELGAGGSRNQARKSKQGKPGVGALVAQVETVRPRT